MNEQKRQPVVKVINLRQVAKEHVPFVLQGQWDEVAELRVVQLGKVALEEGKQANSINQQLTRHH